MSPLTRPKEGEHQHRTALAAATLLLIRHEQDWAPPVVHSRRLLTLHIEGMTGIFKGLEHMTQALDRVRPVTLEDTVIAHFGMTPG
jgi:hypothetical protein